MFHGDLGSTNYYTIIFNILLQFLFSIFYYFALVYSCTYRIFLCTVFNILIYFNYFYSSIVYLPSWNKIKTNLKNLFMSRYSTKILVFTMRSTLEDPFSLTVNDFKDQMVSTVVKLYEIIDFLQKGPRGKMLVETLLLREANGISDLVDESLIENNKNTHIVETMSSSTVTSVSTSSILSPSN